ncbi:hypothetical protein IMZ48_25605 [Candidatus Bathyarchaeota archaeon]|nr:hypothetical protein [Chloroflexota bacterium]MBE3045858.1 hypothetical protein [Candidatus Bathyarchaeota archaeon]MBE3117510.1 hypothetical protein [Candidatus Atribacteria bacterium]
MPKTRVSPPVLSAEQVAFLRGEASAKTFQAWWPLLVAEYIRPNENAPPMFVTTAKGMAAVKKAVGVKSKQKAKP